LSSYIPHNHFTSEKVGAACSYLGAIGPKVGGALVPQVLHCLQVNFQLNQPKSVFTYE